MQKTNIFFFILFCCLWISCSIGNTYIVSNTNEQGVGSLHQAITDANGDSSGSEIIIQFNIPAPPYVIQLTNDLPILTQNKVTIDGSTQVGFTSTPIIVIDGTGRTSNSPLLSLAGNNNCILQSLALMNNGSSLLKISGPSYDHGIYGCYFGFADPAASAPSIKSDYAIEIEGSTTASEQVTGIIIGWYQAGIDLNINSNTIGYQNTAGIFLNSIDGNPNSVKEINIIKNFIGTDVAKTYTLTNNQGIEIKNGSQNSVLNNTILNNSKEGIIIQTGTLNPITSNNISGNSSQNANGISLVSGGNNNQTAPIITSAYLVGNNLNVTLQAPASPLASNFSIEVFSNPTNNNPITEGKEFIGSFPVLTSGQTASTTFDISSLPTPPSVGQYISATATNNNGPGSTPGDTSPFSLNRQITATVPLSISLAGNPTSLCYSSSSELTATFSGGISPYTLTWSDGMAQTNISSSPQTRSVQPSNTTSYTVSIADSASASAISNSVNITVNMNPSIQLTANPLAVLTNGSVVLTAVPSGNAPFILTWSDGVTQNVSGTTSRIIRLKKTTTYSVSVQDTNGCTSTSLPLTVSVISSTNTNQLSNAIINKYG